MEEFQIHVVETVNEESQASNVKIAIYSKKNAIKRKIDFSIKNKAGKDLNNNPKN